MAIRIHNCFKPIFIFDGVMSLGTPSGSLVTIEWIHHLYGAYGDLILEMLDQNPDLQIKPNFLNSSREAHIISFH